jgi:hypothetical protein
VRVKTHYGRPGGRLVEVALALVMVALSLGLVFGFVALMSYDFGLWGNGRDNHRDFDALLVRAVVFASLVSAACVLAYLWGVLLKHYRYDARTLRPIKDEMTAVPEHGSDKSEE